MQKRKKLVIGNWKMYPSALVEAKSIFSKIKRTTSRLGRVQTVICPTSVHISALAGLAAKGKTALGIQDVFWEDEGAFTGQVSPLQARNAGVKFALIGHSERRALGDDSEKISKKVEAAIRAGLIAVVCFGEAQRDREGNFFEELKNQLLSSLGHIRSEVLGKSVVLAYEPVWQIGRADSKGMAPSEVHETVIFIRRIINDAFGAEVARAVPILYGGSVTFENARAIVYKGDVDGLLVGRQSLDAQAFAMILKQIELGDVES